MRKLIGFLILALLLEGCNYQVPEPKPFNMDDLGRGAIAGDLVISSQPTAEILSQLGAQGFRTVISTRGEGEIDWAEANRVKEAGMEYFQVPMEKSSTEITDAQVEQLNQILKHAEKPVLLHCGSANRAASLWTVWLVEKKGVAPDEAIRLGRLMGMTSMEAIVNERLGLPEKKYR